MLMPLLRLMQTRATGLLTGATPVEYGLNQLHREPVLTEGRRLSLSVRPPRRSSLRPQSIQLNRKGAALSSNYFLKKKKISLRVFVQTRFFLSPTRNLRFVNDFSLRLWYNYHIDLSTFFEGKEIPPRE